VILEDYRNINKGQEAVIFTCGPSLNSYDKDKMIEFCKGKKIATIKQAVFRYGDISDYHFFNDNNFLNYRGNYLKIASSANPHITKKTIWKDQEIDYTFRIIDAFFDRPSSISHTLQFDKLFIENGLDRTWGPGIMYETVLPFMLWTGIRKFYINGWDYTTRDGFLDHYYNEEKVGRKLINSGKQIGTMCKGEKEAFLNSTDHLYDYLKERDIEIILLSDCSELSSKFERLDVR